MESDAALNGGFTDSLYLQYSLTLIHMTRALLQKVWFLVMAPCLRAPVNTAHPACDWLTLQAADVLKEYKLPNEFFGEGLAAVNGSLIQLTWLNRVGFVYDQDTFGLLRNFSYSTEGWGLTYDGSNLIMSDGTSKLTFLNPETFEVVRQVSVKDGNNSITNINELEYINGDVYANIWMTQQIAIINPQTGQVKGWIDLSGIYQSNDVNAVLNGIAYDSQTGGLFVTGKNWPNIYEIEISASN